MNQQIHHNITNLDNILKNFCDKSTLLSQKPLLHAKKAESWHGYTWNDTAIQVQSLANYLKSLNLGDKPKIMILMENRPEFIIALYAITAIGGVMVPCMATASAQNCQFILEHSQAKAIIISHENLWQKLSMRDGMNYPIITCDNDLKNKILDENPHFSVENIWEMPKTAFDLAKAAQNITLDDDLVIIYTSGTGGTPKGVLLNMRNILHNVDGVMEIFYQLPNYEPNGERFLSFLPLAHVYEFMVIGCLALYLGAEVYFAESTEKLLQNIHETKPTIMTAVPRLYETMRGKILVGSLQLKGFKAKLFQITYQLGCKQIDKIPLSFWEKCQDYLCDKLVRQKIRARFGGKLKIFVSGGGPLNHEVARFLVAYGLKILQGYGLSETSPVVSVNLPRSTRLDSVGPIIKNTQIKIAEDGEILVKGDLVMQGYWRDPENTAKIIKDGWLYTGDIGAFKENHLYITDRKKDIIINKGGEKIAPQKLEGLLNLAPEIAQSMVYGEQKNFIVALLVLDKELTANLSIDEIKATCQKIIDKINHQVDAHERIKKFIFAHEAFSVSNGQMSPTLKIRRHEIITQYGDQLERLYS